MNLTLPAAVGPLCGQVAVPGDKSLAHRAALFAALADGESEVGSYPDSGVTRAMLNALASLGIRSVLEDGVLRLSGKGWQGRRLSDGTSRLGEAALSPLHAESVVCCGNSGTTFRLLAGVLAATGTVATLDGSEGLRRRPMERIAEPLRLMGADVSTTDGHAPLMFRPSPLHGIEYALPVASSQVLSCLQLAALGADGASVFRVPGPVRDHTTRMLRVMGARIEEEDLATRVYPLSPSNPLKPLKGALPGDISSAAFLLVAAAIVPGSRITVANVGLNPTRTGILDVLSEMGASIAISNTREAFGEPTGDVTLAAAPLHGVSIGGDLVVRSIDEFPAIAAAASFAEGTTTVRDAEELRYKESDRIAAIVTQLRALGAEVAEAPDGFSIRGGTVRGGTARANGDHRLAMSMALCGLRAPGRVVVADAEILNESFPEFTAKLAALRCGEGADLVK
ncbi:MAG: 3-phosphoshikimate 1-carboxyvinyltransferase [Kiritimatiellae bacterium]|nr:3-phosphoshikimate 1-carboxyvinyltransferase [Kiritimatiellia bacterium]